LKKGARYFFYELRERILNFFEEDMIEEEILLPYSAQSLTGELRLKMRVLKETFGEEGVSLLVRAREGDIRVMKEKIARLKN
jgi:GTP-binding protein HflX